MGRKKVDIEKVFRGLLESCKLNGFSICIPFKYGCGIAKGNWDEVSKLFDDSSLIDKSVVTPYDKQKWKKEFQKLCDSDEVRKESEENGLNACGYWYACDCCEESDLPCACANALIDYLKEKGKEVDYKNTSHEYLDKLLRENYE